MMLGAPLLLSDLNAPISSEDHLLVGYCRINRLNASGCGTGLLPCENVHGACSTQLVAAAAANFAFPTPRAEQVESGAPDRSGLWVYRTTRRLVGRSLLSCTPGLKAGKSKVCQLGEYDGRARLSATLGSRYAPRCSRMSFGDARSRCKARLPARLPVSEDVRAWSTRHGKRVKVPDDIICSGAAVQWRFRTQTCKRRSWRISRSPVSLRPGELSRCEREQVGPRNRSSQREKGTKGQLAPLRSGFARGKSSAALRRVSAAEEKRGAKAGR